MAENGSEFSGHSGEFSGYFCKFASIIDNRLLCVPSRSRYVEEVSMITDVPDCLGDPADYCSAVPQEPLKYQQWLMVWMPEEHAYKIINRTSGMLLCVQSRTDRENHRIVHYHDQSLNFQWWELQAVRQECFKVVNKKSRKVLTAKSGCVIQQTSDSTCNSQIQLWHIFPLDHSGYVGEYQLRHVYSSKLLSIKGQSRSDNAQAIIFQDQSVAVSEEEFTNYQVWRLFVRGWDKGGFVIQNNHSGKILCISGRATISKAKAVQYKNQELPHQKWMFELDASNDFKISNVNSDLLLSVQDGATKNESLVVQLEDQPHQSWQFVKLSGDSEIDLDKLIKFYKTGSDDILGESKEIPESSINPESSMKPELSMGAELQKWYENFIQAFALEVLVLLGEFPQIPGREKLLAIADLILSNSTVVAKLEELLKVSVSIEPEWLMSIVEVLWNHDLWCPVFKCLLSEVWSLPTLVKAMTTIRSWISGAGTARTVFLLNKSVAVLGLIHSMKPKPSDATLK